MPHVCYNDRVRRWERIRHLKANGCTHLQISERLGICRNTIDNALAGKGNIKESSPYNLTKKELIVAKLMSEGKSNSRIAELLVLSRKCIDFHTYRIYKKLNIPNDSNICKRVIAVLMIKEALGDRYN